MQLRPPSFALVVAALALTLSAGGVGYAAGTIKTADLANNAVTSPKVRNGTLKTNDLSKKALASLQGATGPAGPVGPAGTPGAPGAPGQALAYGFVQVTGTPIFRPGYVAGFSAVTRVDTGEYCLTPSPGVVLTGHLPTFTVYNNIAGSQPRIYWDSTGGGCPSGAIKVVTYTNNTTVADTVSFGVVVS